MSETMKVVLDAPMQPETYCIREDTIVVRQDGSVAVLKKGTLIAAPVPTPPFTITVTK